MKKKEKSYNVELLAEVVANEFIKNIYVNYERSNEAKSFFFEVIDFLSKFLSFFINAKLYNDEILKMFIDTFYMYTNKCTFEFISNYVDFVSATEEWQREGFDIAVDLSNHLKTNFIKIFKTKEWDAKTIKRFLDKRYWKIYLLMICVRFKYKNFYYIHIFDIVLDLADLDKEVLPFWVDWDKMIKM